MDGGELAVPADRDAPREAFQRLLDAAQDGAVGFDQNLDIGFGEARAVAGRAHWGSSSSGTAYLAPPDMEFPENHPRRRTQFSSVGAIAYDLIPPADALRPLYEWDGLLAFIAAVVDRGPIYR